MVVLICIALESHSARSAWGECRNATIVISAAMLHRDRPGGDEHVIAFFDPSDCLSCYPRTASPTYHGHRPCLRPGSSFSSRNASIRRRRELCAVRSLPTQYPTEQLLRINVVYFANLFCSANNLPRSVCRETGKWCSALSPVATDGRGVKILGFG